MNVSNASQFDPVSPEGHALVMADPALQLYWQDVLDSFFAGRIVDVRNALRDTGWVGEPCAISLQKGEMAVTFKPMQVGAGANVVGGVWKLLRGDDKWTAIDEIADNLAKTPGELAADIGVSMQKAADRICENRLRQPQELTLAEFSEIATVKKLVNHGRKWDVIFNAQSSGFCDSPTRVDALREAHSMEVSNAIYSNSPDAPDFMEKAVFPPENVLAEYPELRVKFADVFEAREVQQQTEKNASVRIAQEDTGSERSVGGVVWPTTGVFVRDMNSGVGHAVENPAQAFEVAHKLAGDLGAVIYRGALPKTWEEALSHLPRSPFLSSKSGPEFTVGEGRFSGAILDVSEGVVTQKINRDGGMVRHDGAKLSGPVVVGSVVDIAYVNGVGVVGGRGVEAGVGR